MIHIVRLGWTEESDEHQTEHVERGQSRNANTENEQRQAVMMRGGENGILRVKPLKHGKPAKRQRADENVLNVTGIFLASAPIFQMSCSWCIAWMTEPAPRNSSALKNACVVRWNMPASGECRPTPITM